MQDINYLGSATNTGLPARDIAIYRVAIASNTPSWKVRGLTGGDALLAVAKDRIPNITAVANGSTTNGLSAGKKMNRLGNEHFVNCRCWAPDILFPGNYYLVVASEGLVSSNATRIGAITPAMSRKASGRCRNSTSACSIRTGWFMPHTEGGESAAFHFSSYPFPTTMGFEVSLENRVAAIPSWSPAARSPRQIPARPAQAAVGSPPIRTGNDGGQSNFWKPARASSPAPAHSRLPP